MKKNIPLEKNAFHNHRKRHMNTSKDSPATSAQPASDMRRRNLTLHDWMTVFAYVDSHQDMSQGDIVAYFHVRKEGALIFTQATLSRKLAQREELEKRTSAN